MNGFDYLFYSCLYAYVSFGAGYFFKKALTKHNYKMKNYQIEDNIS